MGTDKKLLINWSEPSKVNTKYGPKWMRWWVIPTDYLEGFFEFWNGSKVNLKAQGYSIGKNKLNQWALYEWQTYKADFKQDFGRDNTVKKVALETKSVLKEYNIKMSQSGYIIMGQSHTQAFWIESGIYTEL
jgi:hypothetical protein